MDSYYLRGLVKDQLDHIDAAIEDLQIALQLVEQAGNAERVTQIESKLDELKSRCEEGDSEDE